MTDQHIARVALFVGAFLVFTVALTRCAPQPVPAAAQTLPGDMNLSRREVTLAWQACMHETDYVGGEGGTADCGAMMAVIDGSRRGPETFGQALLRRMPHFAAGTDDRPWFRFLQPGPQRQDPPHWPYVHIHVAHYEQQMLSVYRRVISFARGHEPLPCDLEPVEWFGRAVDGRVIASRLASGRYIEADCNADGPRTRQAYLALVDLD